MPAPSAVLFAGLSLYLLLVTVAAAWMLMPGFRVWTRVRVGRVMLAGSNSLQTRSRVVKQRLMKAGSVPALAGANAWQGMRRHAVLLVTGSLLLVAVPALTLWLRHISPYDGFDHTSSREINPQVAALLQGEQLVPPAPLPPALFLTREVERVRPATSTASRRWELLDEEFRRRLLAVYQLMREEHGYEMVLLEGYRSAERQTELAAMGPHVTHAGAGESYHQHGLAADSAFVIDGRIVISEQDPRAARGYELFGAVAQSAGLTWGGGWRSLKDLGHAELRRPGVIRESNKKGS